jgi:transposase
VRRPFYELAVAGSAPLANEMLERIKALYAIEAALKGLPADQRCAARRKRTCPLLAAMETWLRATLQTISQKLKLAEAIRYTLARWEGLTRFVDDGTIEIDSNTVERSIRPIILTRKNALFAGCDRGAEHWAVIASLIETCKLNTIDPEAYLGQTITRIVQGHPQSQTDQLLPWVYASAIQAVA